MRKKEPIGFMVTRAAIEPGEPTGSSCNTVLYLLDVSLLYLVDKEMWPNQCLEEMVGGKKGEIGGSYSNFNHLFRRDELAGLPSVCTYSALGCNQLRPASAF